MLVFEDQLLWTITETYGKYSMKTIWYDWMVSEDNACQACLNKVFFNHTAYCYTTFLSKIKEQQSMPQCIQQRDT